MGNKNFLLFLFQPNFSYKFTKKKLNIIKIYKICLNREKETRTIAPNASLIKQILIFEQKIKLYDCEKYFNNKYIGKNLAKKKRQKIIERKIDGAYFLRLWP